MKQISECIHNQRSFKCSNDLWFLTNDKLSNSDWDLLDNEIWVVLYNTVINQTSLILENI